jgi:4-amino-4-deoxy-L-arabinose transferase-like glycosyltransferase
MKIDKIILLLILSLAFALRFYNVGQLPAGIHQDEESHGYNAFSLLHTGRDRYGESFPILFRSFGSYQPPVYTYLATIPVGLFGNNITSVRSISVLAGVLLVLLTYLFAREFFKEKKWLPLIAALVIAIAPWSIYFSRLVAEGNLGVLFFISSLYVSIKSLKKPELFPIATILLAISTHAYYSERIISILFLPLFIILYKNYFLENKKWLAIGLVSFGIVMLPHVFIAQTGALTRRLDEVGYLGQKFILFEFINRYLIYLSPRNVFFDLGAMLGRMPPEMGVYYTTFIVPFFIGLFNLKKLISMGLFKLFVALVLITPAAAALTGDSYYPLRALDLIWLFGLVISVGMFTIIKFLPRKIGVSILILVVIQSLLSFYISYFVLFKYERAKDYGNSHMLLIDKLKNYSNYSVVVDSARYPGAGLRMAYLTTYDPIDLQKQLKSQLKTPYYSKDVHLYEDYRLNNIEYRALDWGEISCKPNILIVGDYISISPDQVKEHNLKTEFELKDISGENALFGYSTNPKNPCN